MSLQEIIQEARALSIEEQKLLITLLVDMIAGAPPQQRNLTELAGLGAEIWHGNDAQSYVNKLRDEW